MSTNEILKYFHEISECGSALELLPIAADIRERGDLNSLEKQQLQDKINARLEELRGKNVPVAAREKRRPSLKQLFDKVPTNVAATDPDFYPNPIGGVLK
jgi:hypothetical protein